MRQYRIFYKRGKAPNFTAIQPAGGLHDNLIDHQEIRDAVEHMRLNPAVEGMSLRLLDNEIFNIIAFNQEAEAPNAFKFAPVEPVVADEPDTVLADESSPLKDSLLTASPDLRVTHYADGRVEVRPLNTFDGKTLAQLREEKGLPPGSEALAQHREMKRQNIAAIYGADPAQQPVDGDTANDGLTNQ